ncbi:unnamed protein product [Tilletia controversa]|uniref:ATPase inhibitor, mitochondrial n=3 Tax=Tilletia TaxID=13289 RepID=A0A8X7MWN0_9BASI|nr:hypothetical protein CF336_g2898 [Tilletia laevis]KAE8199686.1 hypothetical protein CF328_g3178 [Tilletia controversa]KAE8262700.1 hypothetical protein A4X03_0g2251 [Tilletia caries]KAE8206155.1 hypothetical protein CF335_g2053 [Tilletia laevis]KAE8250017.1 hypothetical protein A4X06_0g2964 [Tilletia controversa]
MLALVSNTAARTLTRSLAPAALAGARLAAPVRFYADGDGKTPSPGTTGSFKKREQSEEAAYVRSQEKEKLKKLRESIAKQKAHLEEVEKALDDVSGDKK